MAPPAPFSVHQVTHKTISKPAAAAHAKDFESDPHNLWLFYEHPRLLTIDKFTGTANLYEIVPGKEPRQLITIDHVPGTPPGHPFVKITDDWVIFWTEVTLSSTALSIYDIRTGKEIGSHMVDGGRTNLAGILYENGKLVLTLEDPKTTTAVPTVKGRRKNHLAVLEFNKSQGEFVRIADYWPSEKSVAESMYDGPVIPLHITKSNELIAAHSKHPSGTAEILKWSLSDKSGKAVPTEIALESTRGKDYGANSIDYAAHLYIPTLNSLIVAHSQRILDSADSNPQIAIRSINPSTLKVNWTANVDHGVGHLHFNSESGLLVVTSGQQIGGATVLDAKSGKLVQSAKLRERDLRSVGSSPGGEEIVLLDRQRKIEVVPVAEFAKNGVAGARSFTLPGEVFKSTKEADSWIRQCAVGSKTIVLAQATSNNWAVVHWEGARAAPAA